MGQGGVAGCSVAVDIGGEGRHLAVESTRLTGDDRLGGLGFGHALLLRTRLALMDPSARVQSVSGSAKMMASLVAHIRF